MRQGTILLLLAVAIGLTGCNQQTTDRAQTVNPIIGDISFASRFGHSPTSATDEALRIRMHLAYVGHLLRGRDVSRLAPVLRARRALMLQSLHDYQTAGVFPKNYDHPGVRVPCFIDKAGRICAVGYLIEQTAGRQVAESINSAHQYEELLAMNDPTVDDWIAGSGLTKSEAAMIQPAYGYHSENYIPPAYGISSSVLGGVNLSMCALNSAQLAKPTNNKAVAIIGMFTGAGQAMLGAANFPGRESSWHGSANESLKVLSMVNIGLGTATAILSTWNLFAKGPPKEKRTTWNVYSFPTQEQTAGVGFSVTRKF